jgi:drug/metabolite transporter (DMT)-like permease
LLLDEPLSASMVVGGLIALAGVSLTNWTPSAARVEASTEQRALDQRDAQ